jgi:hypothetical protein
MAKLEMDEYRIVMMRAWSNAGGKTSGNALGVGDKAGKH